MYCVLGRSMWQGIYSGLAVLLMALGGCSSEGGASAGSGDPKGAGEPSGSSADLDKVTRKAFPVGLALASPLRVVPGVGSAGQALLGELGVTRQALSDGWSTGFMAAADELNAVLSGTIDASQALDPEVFFRGPGRAACFGPSIQYEAHPDAKGSDPTAGDLPGGDLGIWLESEVATGEACAAAQLNQLLSGASEQANGALAALASMLAVASGAGLDLPEGGETLDLTSEMDAAGLAELTIASASVSQSDEGAWRYGLEMTYSRGGVPHQIVTRLEHTPSADSDGAYEGLLYYRVTGTSDTFPGGNCTEAERTYNGSLRYIRSGAAAMSLQARGGIYCGGDVDGRVSDPTDIAAGQVDPTQRYPAASDGWSENFNLFVAEFDPESAVGNYVYIWQAGGGDSHGRAFAIGLNDHDPPDGEAYFGYSDPLDTTDGTFKGMFCSWAAPGSSHTLQPYVQRQFVSFDESQGIFTQPAGGSDIRYAPTNDCQYDGSGAFLFDTDADGDLTDEAGGAFSADLFGASSGETIAEAVAGRGFDLPEAAGGWPAD